MGSNWFIDNLNSSKFDDNVEIKQRGVDHLFNLWRKYINFDAKEGFSSGWEVIGVYETLEEAKEAKEKIRGKR